MLDDKTKQAEFIHMAGGLLHPIQKILDRPEEYDETRRKMVFGEYWADIDKVTREIHAFASRMKGYDLTKYAGAVEVALINCGYHVENEIAADISRARATLESYREQIINAVRDIPIDIQSETLQKVNPFTAYVKMRAWLETVRGKLIFVDPFVNDNLFTYYLRHTRKD